MQATSCLLCGATEGNEVFRNPKDKYFRQFDHLRGQDSILVLCARCGFAYHNPKLSETETDRIYRVLYRPAVPSEDFLAEKQKAMVSHREFIGRYLPLDQRRRLLDIGCSEGSFLEVFREVGWDVYGVEPSETFGRYAREVRKLNVAQAFFDESVFPDVRFDLVSANAVLEHLHDPIKVLMSVRDKLVEGGHVYIVVPNILRPRGNLRRTLLDSTHLYLFSPRTARRLLARAGFKVVAMDTSRLAHLRAIAQMRPLEECAADAGWDDGIDDHAEVRELLRRHQIRWYLRAEWKEMIQRGLVKALGERGGRRVNAALRGMYGAVRGRG